MMGKEGDRMKKEEALGLFMKKEAEQASRTFILTAMEFMKKEVLPERIRELTDNFAVYLPPAWRKRRRAGKPGSCRSA